MGRILKGSTIAVTCALWVTPTVVLHAQDDPSAIVESFHAAIASSDTARVLELLDPGVIIYEAGGAEWSRDEFAAHHMGVDMEFAAAATRTVTDRRSDRVGDLAFVMTLFTMTGTFREREVNLKLAETMVIRWTDDGWRIVHIHWSFTER